MTTGESIRRAVIIAVGSELLTSTKLDTNSLFLTEALNGLGVTLAYKVVIGDDEVRLSRAVRCATDEAELVLVTGGLGATDDDVTRATVARTFDLPMREDPTLVSTIRSRFEARGLSMPEVNRRQALVPRGADVLPNPRGTAPGLWIDTPTAVCILLPGPFRELRPMFIDHVTPRIGPRTDGARVYRKILTIVGRTESHVEELTKPVHLQWRESGGEVQRTILASLGQIELHLTTLAHQPTDAQATLARAAAEISNVLGTHLVSADGESLEIVVGRMLRARHERVAIAESCTGGLIMSRLTDIPGSSVYTYGGWTVYSNQAKIEQLGVDPGLLDRHGAVSEPVVCAMAEAARRLGRVDYGLGITGIAGPSGGNEEKPVGMVWLALANSAGTVQSRRFRFAGERDRVKFQASQTALDMLRRSLLERDTKQHASAEA